MQKVLTILHWSPHSDIKVLIGFLTIMHANVSLAPPFKPLSFSLNMDSFLTLHVFSWQFTLVRLWRDKNYH